MVVACLVVLMGAPGTRASADGCPVRTSVPVPTTAPQPSISMSPPPLDDMGFPHQAPALELLLPRMIGPDRLRTFSTRGADGRSNDLPSRLVLTLGGPLSGLSRALAFDDAQSRTIEAYRITGVAGLDLAAAYVDVFVRDSDFGTLLGCEPLTVHGQQAWIVLVTDRPLALLLHEDVLLIVRGHGDQERDETLDAAASHLSMLPTVSEAPSPSA